MLICFQLVSDRERFVMGSNHSFPSLNVIPSGLSRLLLPFPSKIQCSPWFMVVRKKAEADFSAIYKSHWSLQRHRNEQFIAQR